MSWPRLCIAAFLVAPLLPPLRSHAAPARSAAKPAPKGAAKDAPKPALKSAPKTASKPEPKSAPKPESTAKPAATSAADAPKHLKTLGDAGATRAARVAAARALAAMNNPAAVRSAVALLQPRLAAEGKTVLPILAALGPEAAVSLAPSAGEPGEAGQLALEALATVLTANEKSKRPAPLTPGATAALKNLVPALTAIIDKTPGPKRAEPEPADEEGERELKEREDNHRRRVLPALAVLRFAGPDAAAAVPVLRRELKNSRRAYVFKPCVEALAAVGPEALPALEPLAADEKFPFFREALSAIERIEETSPPRPLDPALGRQLQKLKSAASSPDERHAAAEALRKGGRVAAKAVIPLLDDPNPSIRAAAADALQGPAAARAVPALSKLYLDPQTTRAATHALLRTGPDGVAALGQRLDEFDGRAYPPRVLAEALKAIAEHRPPADLAAPLGGILADVPADVLGAWIDAVAAKASPQAVAQLKLVVLAEAQYPLPMRRRAAQALGKLGDAGEAALKALSRERDPDVANPAREALGLKQVEHPLDAVARGLDAPDRATRLAALEKLRAAQGQGHGARAKATLARALKAADEEVRARALLYLGSGADAMPDGVDAVALLKDPGAAVRRSAAAVFRAFPVTTPEPLMELGRLSRDDRSEAVRKEAAGALANLRLEQDAERVRSGGGVHAAPVLRALLKKLNAAEPADRRLAALALAGRLGRERPEVAAALKALLDDPDARVRAAAVEVLLPAGATSAPDWAGPLAALLDHRHPDVRLAAADRVHDLGLAAGGPALPAELARVASDGGASPDARLYAACLLWAQLERAGRAANAPARPAAGAPFDAAREGLRHPRRWVRRGSAAALLDGARAADGLKAVTGVLDDPLPGVAADAAGELVRRFGQRLAATAPATPEQVERVTFSLADPDPVTRRNAAVGLGRQRAAAGGVAHVLAAAAEREQNPAVRRAMTQALSKVLGAALAGAPAGAPVAAQPSAPPAAQPAARPPAQSVAQSVAGGGQ